MALRLLLAILLLAVPLELPGCGPYLPTALFHTIQTPESPGDFERGRLGILLPTYERFYQVIAYRYLAGAGLNGAEQQAVEPPQPVSMDVPAPSVVPNPWLAARNATPGIKPIAKLDPYREVHRQGYFNSYLNCGDDAFRTAAATLTRIRKTGKSADWIAAQDMVFADCSGGAAIPQPATDPKLLPDRNYQIAAAKFYSEQYDAARQDFQTIAWDASSPWRGMAPYLAVRCLIRAGKLAPAEAELQTIADDPAMAKWHAPAIGLLGYVRSHLRPAERMHQLALALARPDSQATLGQDLIDYRMLFDQDVKPQSSDDLTDWIRSFQAGGTGAREQWNAHRTLPWLVAALQFAHPRDTDLAELLGAAAAVKPDSPAYLTVSYHRVRLLPPADARTLADSVLAGALPTAARNQLRAERLRLVRDFDEFLRYAARQPVAEVDYEVRDLKAAEDYLDADAAEIFNRALPLALLKQAASGNHLPERIRQDLQRAAAVRELLLSDAPPFDRVFALLKTPGARPDASVGSGRFTKAREKIDPYRDNWWCAIDLPTVQGLSIAGGAPHAGVMASFLSAADREKAAAEVSRLRGTGTAPEWMAGQTLAFAQAHPQDPRIPEALSLVVRATRYGCTGASTGDFSKRAFDLLHQRYPDTEWARKTPYWFK